MMRRPKVTDQGRTERWKREDEAPRLHELFPSLEALELETDEREDGRSNGAVRCTRPINVGRAGALFEIRCGESRCDNPGHDITGSVINGLRHGESTFVGEDYCSGMVGQYQCKRILRFVVRASWRKADKAAL
jgi:hypothetical protein